MFLKPFIFRTLKIESFIFCAKDSHFQFHFRWNSSHLTYCAVLWNVSFFCILSGLPLKNVGDTFLQGCYCCVVGASCESKFLCASLFFSRSPSRVRGGHYDIWKDKTTNSHFTRFSCNVYKRVFSKTKIKAVIFSKVNPQAKVAFSWWRSMILIVNRLYCISARCMYLSKQLVKSKCWTFNQQNL